MVYQNPGTALNPSIRVGKQLAEVFTARGSSKAEAHERSLAMLRQVQIADPTSVMERYPHQLSGGMQQRVVIAMALGVDPALLILDEPTTGLDATVEAEVLDLITKLQAEFHTAVLFISHNLGVIRKMCSRVGVLYAGEMVEEGTAEQVLHDPRHPYTVGLLRCIPRGGVRKDHGRLDTIPGYLPPIGADLPGCVFADRCALAEDICHEQKPEAFPVGGGHFSRCFFHQRAQELPRAMAADLEGAGQVDRRGEPLIDVDDLSKIFSQGGAQRARAGRRLERDLARRDARARGRVGLRQDDVRPRAARHRRADRRAPSALDGRALAPTLARRTDADVRALQIVFQNPDSALNRRHTVRRILRRSLKRLAGITGSAADERIRTLTAAVRLPDRAILQRPAQLSGGQKQRVAIARAFAGRAAPGRLRRAHLRARRLGAGRDPQPARGAAIPARHRLPLHLARPRRRALPLGSHRGAVPRAPDGARHGRGRVQRAAPSVHRGAALGGADDRRRAAPAHPPRGRHPERRRPAHRLRLPHALPALPRRQLRERGAAAGRGRARPPHALPHPDRGAAPAAAHASRRSRWPATDRGAAQSPRSVSSPCSARARRPGRRGARAGRPHRRHAGAGRAGVGADPERRPAPRARRRALQPRARPPRRRPTTASIRTRSCWPPRASTWRTPSRR